MTENFGTAIPCRQSPEWTKEPDVPMGAPAFKAVRGGGGTVPKPKQFILLRYDYRSNDQALLYGLGRRESDAQVAVRSLGR